MNNISISQLKVNPSKFISLAGDYPVAVEKRNKIQAYLVGKNLYEKIIDYLENYIDQKAIEQTDFKKGRDFEKIAFQLGI
ncbi:prevent-host-death protein [Candidatus Roizmanbacteria bacterium]|nr:prevent-host-death protein [Candidatus Roizmanbacteria bacterium]